MPVITPFRRSQRPPDDAPDDPGSPGAPGPAPLETLRTRLAHWRTWRTRHRRTAVVVRRVTTALSAVLVLGALLLPNTFVALEPNRFARIPAEAVVAAVLLLCLPRVPRLVAAALFGTALGALTVLNLLDMGFTEYLGRSFNLVLDWGLLDDAQSYVADSMGGTAAAWAAVGAVALTAGLVVLMALAAVRLGELLAAHRERAARGALMAATVWMTCVALGVQTFGVPLATTSASRAAEAQAHRVVDTLRDEAAFAKEAKADRFGATPGAQLVPDLRGKDMVFAFIESYGRSAVEDPVMAPGVGRTLDARTEALAKAGFHARSGWLTSATYGGSSWLGHSTFLSGLWVDNQQRYRTVTAGDHLTLTKAFEKTGDWDTVGIMPGVQKAWPEADWYGLDKVYDAFGMGYRGPKFSWSTMPDQYALEAFQRLEHGRKRDRPLMAEVILTSSHQPWAPIPRMVGWDEVGDGSVYDGIEAAGVKASDVITDSARSKEEYGKSIEYSVTSLTQWLERYGTDDTVLVFLGDHQPLARVSGNHASRDVPVSIVAKDPEVLDAIDDWHWTEGLEPAKDAPVWRMSDFRDRFLTAYGSTPHPTGSGG
ncbi:CDP-alcohol phosphatidyltransferase [Streptomyces sp. R1]|uniref:CDP-alcohol phosphatidyltransferase n=1 Tax=Streptomyces TaxID=1883 RepID=UPI001384582D|nr:CDP-alcohol phosphatidyltransferase [Streptomyces sp. R1]MCC8338874.1 CDP-alcohol phosphatidyltransferase [Streptomyces sp. R1]MDA4885660.1 CDP-alcohol phosphatidyltransferase [Streptomyces sp. MS2A]MYS49117.1 CDP-alcohol phosphatidyltransferase [Streptomyces sp. SID6013]